MAELMNELLKEFNKIDKELNDLYHETALRMNLSDSAFSMSSAAWETDACKRISAMRPSPTSRRYILPSGGWKRRAISICGRGADGISILCSRRRESSFWKRILYRLSERKTKRLQNCGRRSSANCCG